MESQRLEDSPLLRTAGRAELLVFDAFRASAASLDVARDLIIEVDGETGIGDQRRWDRMLHASTRAHSTLW
jgi:hypothetical protein